MSVPQILGMAALGAQHAATGGSAPATEGSVYEGYRQSGKAFADIKRRSGTKTDIETNGVGLYRKIQNDLITHQAALQNDGARTIQDAIAADKAQLANTNRGSISTAGAVAYSMKPAEKAVYGRLVNQSEMTLEEAKLARTAFGRAAANARRAGNRAGEAVFNAAYDQLGDGMKARITELQGTPRPYEHYNNQFKASFELENGIAGEMMESLRGQDAQASIPKLKTYANSNLAEIQEQMRTIGLDQQAKSLGSAQRDAKALVDAHDVVNGKYMSGVWRLFMQEPKTSVAGASGHVGCARPGAVSGSADTWSINIRRQRGAT
jgi:hypothetical protein